MITTTLLALIAYVAIVAAIMIFCQGVSDCNQDCNQGRDCDCDDEWNFK